MDKLYLKFIALLLASSVVSLAILRAVTGELDAAMLYALTVVSAGGAGRWYAKMAVSESGKAVGDS